MRWVRIRSAAEEDIDAIMELESVCFSLPWARGDYERDIGENILSYYVVAETKGTAAADGGGAANARGDIAGARPNIVAGYGGVWVVADECHIMTIAVAPEHRQAGIGAMMFMKLMDEARLRGARRFFLEVRVSNAAAISMYEKFGFRTIDTRKAYYSDNKEDAAIMYKEEPI
ncbi:MAG: ribosomal protein S18-alanine N-acetyltransferase [Clostridiales Family XIII bacterium]|jgi:ribosomal-protein-alanine N-acetyltransferase|nr:ribosomal protein S18-alanine N-acetyltransferase [Clostridiales Family XIII bacterium]